MLVLTLCLMFAIIGWTGRSSKGFWGVGNWGGIAYAGELSQGDLPLAPLHRPIMGVGLEVVLATGAAEEKEDFLSVFGAHGFFKIISGTSGFTCPCRRSISNICSILNVGRGPTCTRSELLFGQHFNGLTSKSGMSLGVVSTSQETKAAVNIRAASHAFSSGVPVGSDGTIAKLNGAFSGFCDRWVWIVTPSEIIISGTPVRFWSITSTFISEFWKSVTISAASLWAFVSEITWINTGIPTNSGFLRLFSRRSFSPTAFWFRWRGLRAWSIRTASSSSCAIVDSSMVWRCSEKKYTPASPASSPNTPIKTAIDATLYAFFGENGLGRSQGFRALSLSDSQIISPTIPNASAIPNINSTANDMWSREIVVAREMPENGEDVPIDHFALAVLIAAIVEFVVVGILSCYLIWRRK